MTLWLSPCLCLCTVATHEPQACCHVQWRNYPGGNIAEEGTLATSGGPLTNSQKNFEK